MCRYASDLKPMLRAMATTSNASRLRLDNVVHVDQLNIFVCRGIDNPLLAPVRPAILDAIDKAVEHLNANRAAKSRVTEVHFEQMRFGREICGGLWSSFAQKTPLLDIMTLGQVGNPSYNQIAPQFLTKSKCKCFRASSTCAGNS